MKILRIYSDDNSVDVQYKTDLISENQTNFTVMSIEGLDEAEIVSGINFKQLPYDLPTFIEFATENGYGLSSRAVGTPVDQNPVVLVEPQEIT